MTKSLDKFLHNLRLSLSRPEAMVQLAVLGLAAGVFSGTVIIVFRTMVEVLQSLLLPEGIAENYEALSAWLRFIFPVCGTLLIFVLFKFFAQGQYVYGVVHVLERLAYHQGKMHPRNLIIQFIGAGITIISGFSVGREGPSVHLGAASSSLVGGLLDLPKNALRTLVGCGCAAAIAASFNTPLAGVIFALEVIMMEYSLASFTPVILAAVSATALSRAFHGPEPAFSVPQLELASLTELPYMLLVGILVGSVSAVLIWLTRRFAIHSQKLTLWSRLLVASLLTGIFVIACPEIMGIGYDTVTQALLGDLGIGLLAGILIFKVMATAVAIGYGLPAGIIGPTFFIGAAIGGVMGIAAQSLYAKSTPHQGLYALLDMGAMMGATLQAPLAALVAVTELTYNPNIILPGMLSIVVAGLVCRQLFGQQSIFTSLMRCRGLDYRQDPILQAMRRVGVASIMNRKVERLTHEIDRIKAETLLTKHPDWIVIDQGGKPTLLLPALDLARYLKDSSETTIDLLKIPAKRLQITAIHLQASVDEALERLHEMQADAVYVDRPTVPGIRRIYGILTRETLESSYRI